MPAATWNIKVPAHEEVERKMAVFAHLLLFWTRFITLLIFAKGTNAWI